MKKILLCGLGAVGLSFISWCRNKDLYELKILVDQSRYERYIANPPVFNGTEQYFNYVLPYDHWDPDLVVIATKLHGLGSALSNLKHFIKSDTKVMSLLNGVSSEAIISKEYPEANVLKSYYIGHTASRIGNRITQDGVGKIVVEKDEELREFFNKIGLSYEMPDDIDYSMWLKFSVNVLVNQTSSVLKMSFGEMKKNKHFLSFAKNVIDEVRQIAEKKGIGGLENLEKDTIASLSKMGDNDRTSMFQDILAKRPTEVDMFAGEIIKLGKEYQISTPYNQVLYDLIKIEEERNEHSLHTC